MTDKPLVEPHVGPAPDDLLIEEIVVGTGAEALPGQTAVVHYVGVAASTGEEFDASWNRGDTFSFPRRFLQSGDHRERGRRAVRREAYQS